MTTGSGRGLIARYSPLGFGLLYLALIPIFGFIYSQMPREFYHQTAKFEPAFAVDRKSAEQYLGNAIAANFEHVYGATSHDFNGWEVTTDDLHVTNLQPTEDNLTFSVSVILRKQTDAGLIVDGTSITVTEPFQLMQNIVGDEVIYSGFSFNPQTLIPAILASATPGSASNVSASVIFPNSQSLQFAPDLPVDIPTNNLIVSVVNAWNGFPAQSSGEWQRMLYFSATTVTTLGYGDILPITDSARFWTAIESVTGIVVIGLFLNALARIR